MAKEENFQTLDVTNLIAEGIMPLPEIERRLAYLQPGEGLIVVAPFLPSPLIQMLRNQGWASMTKTGEDGAWRVYFWRRSKHLSSSAST